MVCFAICGPKSEEKTEKDSNKVLPFNEAQNMKPGPDRRQIPFKKK